MNNFIYTTMEETAMKDRPTRIFVVGGSNGYANWLPDTKIVTDFDIADAILLTGGADVSPSLYGQPKHKTTSCNPRRDELELTVAKTAIKKGKLIIGICRGAQLACVVAGGQLIQHQDNPHMIHPVQSYNGRNFLISSLHHQAMFPFKMKGDSYFIIAHTNDHSKYHLDGDNKEMSPKTDVEICYFPKIRALAIQGHPEMLWNEKEHYQDTFNYLQPLYTSFVKGRLAKEIGL